MSRADFLLEVGCEEIPARMIEGAVSDLRDRILGILESAGLESIPGAGAVRTFATPRRLAVLVPGVPVRQPDREEDVTGPPASAAIGPGGEPTRAALAFARKLNVSPSELKTVSTPKGDYLGLRRAVQGRGASEILAEGLPRAIAGMTFPKTMRWGDGERRFVRPVHWVVALLADRVVPFDLLGVSADRFSAGHRVLGRPRVEIPSAGDYERTLLAEGVVADRQQRRRTLAAKLEELARSEGVRPVEDVEMLEEVVDLVEYPGAVLGSFPREFLELPRQILVTTLRHHQKSHSTETLSNGGAQVSNHFLSVADAKEDPEGHIRRGNEWVVVGRLDDARFFFQEDQKLPFASRREKLKRIIFHTKAGSYLDKSERVERIALSLARRIRATRTLKLDEPSLTEAARLCKCDLTTGLVGEFPELQGIAGAIYLEEEWRRASTPWRPITAGAVRDQYKPAGAKDSLPEFVEGKVLALADRLDTLAVLARFIGLPRGSKDPYALRRSAYAAVRIVAEGGLPLRAREELVGVPFAEAVVMKAEGAVGATGEACGEIDLLSFLMDRLQHWLREEKGARYDTINAVLLASGGQRAASETLPRLAEKVLALERLRDLPDIAALIEMHKRCRNIEEQARGVGRDERLKTRVKEDPEEGPAREGLARQLEEADADVARLMERDAFEEALQRLAQLRPALARFFDHVLVMHPDPELRGRRLTAVRRTANLIEGVADLKQVAISREEMQERLAQLAGQVKP